MLVLRTSNDWLLDFERRTVGSRGASRFTYRFGKGSAGLKAPKKKKEGPTNKWMTRPEKVK